MILITPANASAPYTADPGPRITSIRAIALTGMPAQTLPRLPNTRSVTGMPLISMRVCALELELMPRMMNLGA
jgi:hypothetical protein